MTTKTPMAEMAGEITEAVVNAPMIGLKVLLAEMQALGSIMPGAHQTEAERSQHEAAVEADFDNMPV